MPLTPDQLPDDVAELKARLIAQDAELAAAKNGLIVTQLTIEKLKAQIARLRREKFGASSERIERAIAQLELALEEAETAKAEAIASAPPPSKPEMPSPEAQPAEAAQPEKKQRRQLPPEFARRDVVHMPAGVCKVCGGPELRTVSESVTEVLAYIPARFEVVRHVRPACSCRKCETMVQAPMPELPIPRGMVDASLLAHIAVAKFCDHIPRRLAARRRLCRLRPTLRDRWGTICRHGRPSGSAARRRGRVLGARAARLLRRARVEQVGDRQGGARSHRRPVRHRTDDRRAAAQLRRSVRGRTARPKLDELATWLDTQLQKIPGKSDLAGAIRYARSRWTALSRYLDAGRPEISNNAAENQIRPVALGRNYAHVRIMRSCGTSLCRIARG
jgi:transposase